jgi:hypothetical protein
MPWNPHHAPPPEPYRQLAFEHRGDVKFGYVVSSSEEVDEARVLARNFDALFTKEHRNLLVSLEVTNTRYGKKIACVLGRGRLRRV